jgi:hypothetical protein
METLMLYLKFLFPTIMTQMVVDSLGQVCCNPHPVFTFGFASHCGLNL